MTPAPILISLDATAPTMLGVVQRREAKCPNLLSGETCHVSPARCFDDG